MSARKPTRAATWPVEAAAPPPLPASKTPAAKPLVLEPDQVTVRKNGIEFRSSKPFPAWIEVTVSLLPPHSSERITCTGVVVSCAGNRHLGYTVSLHFSGMTPHDQRQLDRLARSSARL